jgi:hypothetical protein
LSYVQNRDAQTPSVHKEREVGLIAENPQPENPIGAALSRNLGSPTAPGEKVETELDAFIERREKRRRQTEGERSAKRRGRSRSAGISLASKRSVVSSGWPTTRGRRRV